MRLFLFVLDRYPLSHYILLTLSCTVSPCIFPPQAKGLAMTPEPFVHVMIASFPASALRDLFLTLYRNLSVSTIFLSAAGPVFLILCMRGYK